MATVAVVYGTFVAQGFRRHENVSSTPGTSAEVQPGLPIENLPRRVQFQTVSTPPRNMEALLPVAPAAMMPSAPEIVPPVGPAEIIPEVAAAELDVPDEPVRQIDGRIFLASQTGLNYQPPSVEVRLYALSSLKPYLEKRSSESSAKFEELKSQIKAAEAEKERLRHASNAAFDAYLHADPHAADARALEQASAEAKKAREKATNAYYSLLQNREELLSGAYYLQDLPMPEKVTRTDGDGRFSFDVPTEGDFAVVAGTERSVNEATERYYWFVPVSTEGEARKTVFLSNNNLSSQGSTDSLVQTVD